jgi:hypothetical protein
MGSRIDKFVRKRKSVKADRSTELGIAGHEAAKAALDRQITTPMKYLDSNHWPEARTPDFRPVGHGDEMITPGMGHVTTYNVNIAPSGRYRGINLTRRGTAGIGDPNNQSNFYNDKNTYIKKSVDKILKQKKEKEDE